MMWYRMPRHRASVAPPSLFRNIFVAKPFRRCADITAGRWCLWCRRGTRTTTDIPRNWLALNVKKAIMAAILRKQANQDGHQNQDGIKSVATKNKQELRNQGHRHEFRRCAIIFHNWSNVNLALNQKDRKKNNTAKKGKDEEEDDDMHTLNLERKITICCKTFLNRDGTRGSGSLHDPRAVPDFS